MFSNDNNIETISKLVESLKHYIGLQGEYVKLDIIEKTVKIFTFIGIISILCIFFFLMLIYLGLAAAYALAPFVGNSAAFAIVAGVYFILLLLFLIFRKQWIEKPLIKFLTSLLLSK